MKPPLLRSLLVPFICLFFAHSTYTQVLLNKNLNLNPGGAIYDVAYDSYLDAYILVGDFNEINGISVSNIAFVDADDFTVLSSAVQPIITVDGPIRTVEVHKKESVEMSPILISNPGPLSVQYSQGRYSVFIGGDFNTVNGQSRIKLARLIYTFYVSPSAGGSYSLSNWDVEIHNDDPYNYPEYTQVNDINFKGDTMVVVGDFIIDQPSYDSNISRYNIIAFNAGHFNEEYIDLFTEAFDDYSLVPYLSSLASNNEFASIDFYDNKYLISTIEGSNNGLITVDVNSNSIDVFVDGAYTEYNVTDYTLSDFEGIYPLVYVSRLGNNSSNSYPVKYDINGNYLTLSTSESWTGNTFFTSYKDYVYTVTGIGSQPSRLKTYKRTLTEALFESQLTFTHNSLGNSNSFYDWLPNSSNKLWQPKKMIVEQDKLFFTGGYLTHVDGSSHKGLAVLCLEPSNAKPFTVADTTICAGNKREYTVPQTKYAEGYKWTYTGQGASIKINGALTGTTTMNPGQPVYLNGTNSRSVEIEFGTSTTGGVLTVEPYSTCNTNSDYMTSSGQSINLVTAPLPSLTMANQSLAFNCINADSVNLEMIVSGSNYSFSWVKGDMTSADTLNLDSFFTVYNSVSNSDSTISSPYWFYGSAKEPINGCASTDSIYVFYDTLRPSFTQNDLSSSPSVFDCSTNQMTFSANVPGTTIQWGLTNSTTFANDTFTIYSPDTSSFYAHVTDTSNGCKRIQAYGFTPNFHTLSAQYAGYPSNIPTPIDFVKCDSQLIIAASLNNSTFPNDSISWIYSGNYIGETLTLDISDSVNLSPMDTKTYQIVTYSDSSKCLDTSEVVVLFDIKPPSVHDMTIAPDLNCSLDSLVLKHVVYSDTTNIEGWLDALGTNTYTDSITIYNPGFYYYEVESLRNYCKSMDSVEVFLSNELWLNSSPDTVVCINDTVSVQTFPVNYSDPVTYSWSNGSANSTTSAIGGIDDTLIVIANTLDGCVGFDTVFVSINPDLNASFNTIAGCLEGSASIAIDTISGGAGNFSYSLDDQNYTPSGTFTNLDFGSYEVFVQDGIGCKESYNVLIDNSAQGPDLNFLIPTYNAVGDTVVAVNISNFNGFDSLYWDVPGNINVIDANDSVLVFSINDENWYDIGIIAYQDTCSFGFSKSVYFGPYKPSFETGGDTLGITNLTIYPNPTSGQFTVDLSFGVPQAYSIIVTSSNGQVIPQMSVSGNDEMVNESFSFPVGSSTGSYNINIISEHDARNNVIILQ